MNHIISCILILICVALVIYACRLSYKAGITVGREQVLKEDLIRLCVKEKTTDAKFLDKMYDKYTQRVC
jgi:hypothetical protein